MSVDIEDEDDFYLNPKARNSRLIVKSKEQIQHEKDEALVRKWVDEKFEKYKLD